MTVPSRIIAILSLFTSGRTIWTAEDIALEIGVSTSTAYRYTKELCVAGFLDPLSPSGFSLGPAFIQYDYLLRTTDPIIHLASPVMKQIIEQTDPRIDVVLSRLYNNCVLCIHQENGPQPHPPTSYARGIAMPLFVGATSKVILAHMSGRALKRLYLQKEEVIREALPQMTWASLKDELKSIRKQGHCLTISEVTNARVGLAAPVFRDDHIVASLSIVMESKVFEKLAVKDDVFDIVKTAAASISNKFSAQV